jgi:chaperonin GroES
MAKKNNSNIEEQKEPVMVPVGDNVIVLPDVIKEKKTESGFIISEQQDDLTGIVVAVGPGKMLDNGEWSGIEVVEGDHIIVGRLGFQEVNIKGVKYYIVPSSSILAIIYN